MKPEHKGPQTHTGTVGRVDMRGSHIRWAAYIAHLPVAMWVFGGLLFGGRVLFFRDLSVYYYPDYVFLERALDQGVWPLWNPTIDSGSPFLLTDPVDLALVGLLGADEALRFGPPILLLIAMCGATALARRLGAGAWGSWAAGVFYGLSGALLSTVNLVELFHGASWAPWTVAAFLRFWRGPTAGAVALLAVVGAMQIATLSPEVLLQTAALGLALIPDRPRPRHLVALVAAAAVAALLAAPALLGARALIAGTQREAGFPHAVSFAWSATPILFAEAVLPHFFGDVHTMTHVGYWGQPLFPTGIPYLLSLYLGPALLLLAALAGRRGMRLYTVAVLGILLALGDQGPLGPLMTPWMKSLRAPVKFFLMSNLALCLLAGLGIDRRRRVPGGIGLWVLSPGLLLLLAGLAIHFRPGLPLVLLEAAAPRLSGPRAADVVARFWPRDFLLTGVLAAGTGLALRAGRRLVPLAAILVSFDLAIVNEAINPSVPADFYTLRPQFARQVDEQRTEGRYRWFSYGVAYSPNLHFSPELLRRNSDVWLFYLDRQTLLPRTPTLDGLESAFDLDRVGWSLPGSTLTLAEKSPHRFRDVYGRLRLANVRWVISFHPLPKRLVSERARLLLSEVREPLRFFEIRDPLPRALWVPQHEVVPNRNALSARLREVDFDPRSVVLLAREPPIYQREKPAEQGRVRYESVDPHTVRLASEGDPGFLVVLDNFHPAWVAEIDGRQVPLLRADGQYMAIPTPGGSQEITLRFQPGWQPPALAATVLGLILVSGLALAGAAGRRSS